MQLHYCRQHASGDDDVAIVSGGPHHNRSRIRAAFRMAIAGATASIKIETPYFVPGPRFIRALLRAVRRGVKVELILPAKSDVPLVRLVNRSSYATLIKGGIEVYEREGTILHGKVMLIDGRWSVIGSANLDQRSFHRNFEVNVIVSSSDFGRQVDEMFSEDLALSRRISLEEHERRGFAIRLMEWRLLRSAGFSDCPRKKVMQPSEQSIHDIIDQQQFLDILPPRLPQITVPKGVRSTAAKGAADAVPWW